MAYLFTCPHCQTQTDVTDEFSGHSGQCIECRGEIELPHFADHFSSTEASNKSIPSVPVWLRIAAAAAVCLLLTVGLFYSIASFGGRTMAQLTNSRIQNRSMEKLGKIAKAMNAYAADYGTYPPRMTVDNTGAPLHSWRVLLLPYLDETELHNAIRLDLPWDNALNQTHHYSMPSVYSHPQSGNFYGGAADYYVIYGPGTLYPSQGPMGPNSLIDDPTLTLLVVEGSPSTPPLSWMEPVDLDASLLTGQVATSTGGNNEIGGFTDHGAAVATVDGRGHVLKSTLPAQTVMALISPKGGERLADDTLD